MSFDERYRRQVELLIKTIPFIAKEDYFALKGGTAINLFHRNMPRLSVDLDLTYVPVEGRTESLKAIDAALSRIKRRIQDGIANTHVAEGRTKPEGTITKLLVHAGSVQTKIEVTPVLRGCVAEPELRTVTEEVENQFGFAEVKIVPFADLFGGKIVAALDRQHPRDLFDIRDLLKQEGIDDALRRAFIVYLLSHDRPMHEVLAPVLKDISHEFDRGFAGMTADAVNIESLIEARKALIDDIVGRMPNDHREFLVSFERGEPAWGLLGVAGAPDLPAIKWRQLNLDKLSASKRETLVDHLRRALGK